MTARATSSLAHRFPIMFVLRRSLALLLLALAALPARAQVPIAPQLSRAQVAAGEALTLAVRVGTVETPVNDLFGLGFQVHFPAEVFELTGVTTVLYEPERQELSPRADRFTRLVTPEEDLDGDGEADGASYYAYAISLRAGNEARAISGDTLVVTLALRARDGAEKGAYTFAVKQAAGTRGADKSAIPLALGSVAVEVVGGVRAEVAAPASAFRMSATPNPARASTGFDVEVVTEESGPLEVAVYDLLGRRVAGLGAQHVVAGERVRLAVPPLPAAGLYIARARQGSTVQTALVSVVR